MLNNLRSKVQEKIPMSKMAAISIMILGASQILEGSACLIEHFASGDLIDVLQVCLTKVTAGAAAFSPGIATLKYGLFARVPQVEAAPANETISTPS